LQPLRERGAGRQAREKNTGISLENSKARFIFALALEEKRGAAARRALQQAVCGQFWRLGNKKAAKLAQDQNSAYLCIPPRKKAAAESCSGIETKERLQRGIRMPARD